MVEEGSVLPQKPPSSDPLLGTLAAGRYRILALLGEGGMGQVYLAEHEAIQKKIALKVLRPELSHKRDIALRFQQEAISASRIKHPGVLDVFDFGQLENGCFFLAMELLEGNDLAEELGRRGPLPPAEAVQIAIQVARALGAAHAAGVVHRDLKPQNVFLRSMPDGDRQVKLVDFGIAQLRAQEAELGERAERRRLTRTGMIFGTPEYMAPEQAAGQRTDARVDIYSLGILMYEMLTGAVPFTGETFMGVLAAHLNQPLPRLDALYPGLTVSSELESAITRMLAKSPDQRFACMAEVVAALVATPEAQTFAIEAGTRVRAPPVIPEENRAEPTLLGAPPPPRGDETTLPAGDAQACHQASSRPRRSILAVSLLALLILAAIAGGAWVVYPALKLEPMESPARNSAGEGAQPIATPMPSGQAPAQKPILPVPAASSRPELGPAVVLRVESEPAGAVLFKNGAQVCDQTPCEVAVDGSSMVDLVAKKGPATGRARVLPQHNQRVVIRLMVPPAGGKPRPRHRLCERYSEELGIKIAVECPE